MSNFVEDEDDAFEYGMEVSGNKKEMLEATESAIIAINKELGLMSAFLAGYSHN
jgi:hypothetical protein